MAKVFLSAGHGGSDPGATTYGLKEKDINLQTLLACNDVLVAHGVQTVCSRTRDEDDPVQQETAEANASGADLAVSFHANAGGGHGFEGFYYPSSAKGKKLVEIATKHIAALGQEAHGNPIKDGGRLYFVRNTKMPAVLFESFFVDSNDRYIGDTAAEQRAFGVAYAKAILEYLGIAYKESSNNGGNTGTSSKGLYRVRKSWNDAASQIGAYSDIENAKRACKSGYSVFDSNGNIVYSPSSGSSITSYKAKVTADVLNIRSGPGTGYAVVGTISDGGVYTIVEEKNGFGRLKSGAGWISLNYVKRM